MKIIYKIHINVNGHMIYIHYMIFIYENHNI